MNVTGCRESRASGSIGDVPRDLEEWVEDGIRGEGVSLQLRERFEKKWVGNCASS